jgi:hypothetical protein
MEHIERALIESKRIAHPITNLNIDVKRGGGYYSIWLSDIKKLNNEDFSLELKQRNSNLLYIGIATKSLYKRLYEQELQHLSPATFFRSIGAVLGYSPEKGSLFNRKGCNYKFNPKHTKNIILWIDQNIEISFVYSTNELNIETEKDLIKRYAPILNWKHNPNKFQPLKKLKDECRRNARII